MLIEIGVTSPLPKFVDTKDPKGKVIKQQVVYEWMPPFFSQYKVMGHNCAAIKKKPKAKTQQVWRPKDTSTKEPTSSN